MQRQKGGRRNGPIVRARGLYKNGRLWWVRTVYAPLLRKSVPLSTGTADLFRANAIKAMVDMFVEDWRFEHHEWLSRVVNKELTLDDLYDHWAARELDMRRLQLEAAKLPTLDQLAKDWVANILPKLDVGDKSRSEYERHVRYFVPLDSTMAAHELTGDYINEKLTGIIGARHNRNVAASTATRRQYLSSLRQFLKYVQKRVPSFKDPLPDVETPKKGKARAIFYPYPKVRAVLDHVDDVQIRAALALMFGSGMELGAVLAMQGQDVNADGTVVAHGTKNEHREDRTIFVDAWAQDIFMAHARRVLPKAQMFTVNGGQIRRAFYQAQVDAGFIDKPRKVGSNLQWNEVNPHTLHDCRHSYAVNRGLGLDGEPAFSNSRISGQLGHADETMVTRIYKKLNIEERIKLAQQPVVSPSKPLSLVADAML